MLSSVEHNHIPTFTNVFKYCPVGKILLMKLITVICIGEACRPVSLCVWHSAKTGIRVSLLYKLQSARERSN